jgi:xylose isomerase
MSFNLKSELKGHLDSHGKVPFVGSGKNAPRPTLSSPLVFRHYDPSRTIIWLGEKSSIGEVINASLPAWHPASLLGTPFSAGSVVATSDRKFTLGDNWKTVSENKVNGLCQIANALGIPNLTFHAQCDVVEESEADVLETGRRLEEVTPIWKDTIDGHRLKTLWGTANQFSNHQQILGSATSPYQDPFILTAIKQKQALDLTHALGGTLFIVWDGQGGEFDADISRPEIHFENGASMLRKVVQYADNLNIKVAIEPKPFEPSMGQFHRNVVQTKWHIEQAGLKGRVGLNPEFDHAKLDGLDICAEILRAAEDFYTCDANQGDLRVGYDVDRFLRDLVLSVRYWLVVHRVGGYKFGGGTNFDAKPDVKSPSLLHLMSGLCMTLDVLAAGLKIAEQIIIDGELDRIIESIYGNLAFPERQILLSDGVSLDDLYQRVANGYKLKRPASLPADTAHHLIASYIADGAPE